MSAAWTHEPIPAELALDDEPLDDDRLDDDLDRMESVDKLAAVALDPTPILATDADNPVRSWRIEDDGAAEWAMRKLAAQREELRRLEEKRDGWAARILSWFEVAARRHANRARLFEARLEDYALRVRGESEDKVKSVVLPSGRVGTRGGGPKVVVRDDGAFREWALANSGSPLVRIKTELVAGEAGPGEDKALRAVEQEVGRRLVVTLACEHEKVVDDEQVIGELLDRMEEHGDARVALGRWACCDPIEGSEAVAWALEPVVAWVAVLDGGEVAAWAGVEHPEPTAKVTPG